MTDMILIQCHNTIYNINQKYKIQQEQSLTKQSRKKVTYHNLQKQSKAVIFLFSKPCKFKRNKFGWSVV